MTQAIPQLRSVPIQPRLMRDEFGNVVRVGMVVILGVLLYVSVSVRRASPEQQRLLPFQALIRDRPAVQQRKFRELQEGLLEAEVARSTTGVWPSVETLEAQGIPPFARDPTAKGATYVWHLIRAGTSVNYLGIPDQASALAWLLLIQEPAPGVPPDPATDDEEHDRLLDGTVLHVSTWNHADGGRVAAKFVRIPQADGWTQLYAVDPPATQLSQ